MRGMVLWGGEIAGGGQKECFGVAGEFFWWGRKVRSVGSKNSFGGAERVLWSGVGISGVVENLITIGYQRVKKNTSKIAIFGARTVVERKNGKNDRALYR